MTILKAKGDRDGQISIVTYCKISTVTHRKILTDKYQRKISTDKYRHDQQQSKTSEKQEGADVENLRQILWKFLHPLKVHLPTCRITLKVEKVHYWNIGKRKYFLSCEMLLEHCPN